jgi:hypothetical protein
MSKSGPTKTQVWMRNLSWLGGPEGMALVAMILAVPYIIVRLFELLRDKV